MPLGKARLRGRVGECRSGNVFSLLSHGFPMHPLTSRSVAVLVEQEAPEPCWLLPASQVHPLADERPGAGGALPAGASDTAPSRAPAEVLRRGLFKVLHYCQLLVVYFSKLPWIPVPVFSPLSTKPRVLIVSKLSLTSHQLSNN